MHERGPEAVERIHPLWVIDSPSMSVDPSVKPAKLQRYGTVPKGGGERPNFEAPLLLPRVGQGTRYR
jgi:hypothetical protein